MLYSPHEVIRMDPPTFIPKFTFSNGAESPSRTVYAPEVNPLPQRVFPESEQIEEWKDAPPYNRSFKKVKQNREIKMTDYSVGRVSTKRYLAEIKRTATNHEWVGSMTQLPGGECESFNRGIISRSTEYIDRYDAIRAADTFPAVEYSRYFEPEEVQSILNDLKADVISNSFSGFDLLTELAEFPETLEMIINALKLARHPLQGMKELREKYERARRRGKTHEVAHAEIASQWMQYRYGIMPLVYSIVDAVKLLEEGMTEFKTDRAFSVLRSKPIQVPSTESHIAIYRGHETKITVIGKSSYSSPTQRFSDLITTNLFLTAWEMIPLSFVVDWFINVGDVIFSRTSTIVDLSKERKFCYSIRRTLIDKHVLNYKFTDGALKSWGDWSPYVGPGCTLPGPRADDTHLNMGSILLYERTEESYERRVFSPNTVDINVGPDLGWQRMLDAYFLSFSSIRKLLKKLS